MTAEEVTNLLPTGQYPDLLLLIHDIRGAFRKAFPDCEKIERDTPPFEAIAEPGKPQDATVVFRPDDSGKAFFIQVVSRKVERVFPVEYRAEWLA